MNTNLANTTVAVYAVLNGITAFILFIIALAITFLTPFAVTMMLETGSVALPPEMTALALQQLSTGVGIIAGIIVFLFAAFFLALARGLWNRHTWARYMQLAWCVPQLLTFPIGTIVGLFGIYAFGFNKEIRRQFGVAITADTKSRVAPARKKKK
jgi:hypothetical protein